MTYETPIGRQEMARQIEIEIQEWLEEDYSPRLIFVSSLKKKKEIACNPSISINQIKQFTAEDLYNKIIQKVKRSLFRQLERALAGKKSMQATKVACLTAGDPCPRSFNEETGEEEYEIPRFGWVVWLALEKEN